MARNPPKSDRAPVWIAGISLVMYVTSTPDIDHIRMQEIPLKVALVVVFMMSQAKSAKYWTRWSMNFRTRALKCRCGG